jgi:hypothetical protein
MKRRDYFGINFSFWSIAWEEALQPSSNEKGQPIRQQPQKSRRYTTWYEVRTMSLCFMNQKDGASAWLFSLPLSNTSVIAKKHRGETIVTEIKVEGRSSIRKHRSRPRTRGYSYPRLIKTSHKDCTLFLDPIDPETLWLWPMGETSRISGIILRWNICQN